MNRLERAEREPTSRSRILLALSVGLWCWAGLYPYASAQPRPARAHLDWHVPPTWGCIPRRELEREVEVLLGRPVFTTRARAHHVLLGDVQRNRDQWTARLSLLTSTGGLAGQREISADGECASLNRPLVIVIATLLDTTDADQALPRPTTQAALELTLGAEIGTLPRAALGAGVSGELSPSAAWPTTRVSFIGWLPQHAIDAGTGARFLAAQAGLSLCPRLWTGASFGAVACFGLELGVLHAQSLGLVPARAPSRLLASVPLEASVIFRLLNHFALRVGLLVSVAALRPAFYLQDERAQRQLVHRVGLLSGGLRFGFIADAL
jgi:hypothetical protein